MNELTLVIERLADLFVNLSSSVINFFIVPGTTKLNFFGIIFLPIIVITIIEVSFNILIGGNDDDED